ncbi:MAG: hypothetical protein ACLR1R_00915 [Ruminococcus callidus]
MQAVHGWACCISCCCGGSTPDTQWINGGVWAITLLLCVAGCLFAPYPARLAQVLWGILAGGCFFGSARLVFHPLEHLAHPNVFVEAVPVGLLHRIPVIS